MSQPDALPFVFSGPHLDRLAMRRKDDAWLHQALTAPDTCFVPVCGEHNVVMGQDQHATPLLLPAASAQPLLREAQCTVLLGQYQCRSCFGLGLSESTGLPPDATFTNLRTQFGVMHGDTLALLGYARVMVHWHLHNRFCGRCGGATESRRAGHELHCAACGNILYPRLNPAIIVLVSHGARCLLAHETPATPPRYSTIAGFVEPGEDLESALRREVFEETNIRVGALRYRHSQPWPYPASLMLGFQAEALNTDIHCNDGELLDARWFSRDELLTQLAQGRLALPTRQSISYRLLCEWFTATGGRYSTAALDAASAQPVT
ncbi:MAG TPA: NAD(+) diphosphatase [Gammaproteobacteria bacterium]|nr:NAD(+) diphosphatase [Gammaproteobacteria bacterium]